MADKLTIVFATILRGDSLYLCLTNHAPYLGSDIGYFHMLLNLIMQIDMIITDNIIIIRGFATDVTTRIIYGNISVNDFACLITMT